MTRGAKMEVTDEGEEIIAGHKARYVRGTASGRNDLCMEICCLDADNGDLVMIHSVEQSKSKFDRVLVDPIFNSIKGFK